MLLSGEEASRLLHGLIPFLVKALSRAHPPILGGGNSLLSGGAVRHRKKGGAFDPLVALPRPRCVSEAAAIARENTEAEVLRVVCRLMEITANVDTHLR